VAGASLTTLPAAGTGVLTRRRRIRRGMSVAHAAMVLVGTTRTNHLSMPIPRHAAVASVPTRMRKAVPVAA
jgi:hypothetical protein